MNITRKQLRELGASEYLAKKLTYELQPTDRQGRAYVYELESVLRTIRDRLDTPKTRLSTRIILAQLEVAVGGLVEEPISNQSLLNTIAEAAQANTQFERTAQQARKAAQKLQDYQRKRSPTFSTHNNIVTFKS